MLNKSHAPNQFGVNWDMPGARRKRHDSRGLVLECSRTLGFCTARVIVVVLISLSLSMVAVIG